MLTKNKNPKMNYASRLFVLPLAAIVFLAFTVKVKSLNNEGVYEGIAIKEKNDTIPLVVDSSHKSRDKVIYISNDNRPKSSSDSIPQYYNGKKIKSAQGSGKLNKALITYEDGSKDTVPIAKAEELRIIPPPPPVIIRQETFTNTQPDKVFTKTEVEASFPGGKDAWARYLKKIIEKNIDELSKENKSGTCRLRFIVGIDGSISDIKVMSMQGTKLAEVAVDAIRKGPRWTPAQQNGHFVASYREQPVTFTIQNNDKVFTKVEVEPSFPGGDMAWARYIKKTVEGNINELTTENKSGTCRLRFIVDVDGSVRDVKVLSMQGTKLAEISENAIRKGPKWVPAKQNGNVVSAYKEQPITFTIQEQ